MFSIGAEESPQINLPKAAEESHGSAVESTSTNPTHGKGHKHAHGKEKKEHSASAAVRFLHRMRKKKGNVSEADPHMMFVLGEHPEEENRWTPAFVELDELCMAQSGEHPPEWREVARWIKYEEEVEESADRWSKPHVAVQSLMSIFEVRSCLSKAVMLMDLDTASRDVISDEVVGRLVKKKQLAREQADQLKELLLAHHSTLYSRHKRNAKGAQQLHIIRSLADIGKRHSAKDVNKLSNIPSKPIIKSATNLGVDRMDHVLNTDVMKSANLNTPSPEDEASSPPPYDHHFYKKVPHGAEAVNILVGETTFLKHPISVFVRLKEASTLGDMTEVPVPTRFMFILLGTAGNGPKYQQIGRAVGTLFSDEMFHDFAVRSTSRSDLLAGIDEFLSASLVLPPAQWDPKARIEPPLAPPSQENRKLAFATNSTHPHGHNALHHDSATAVVPDIHAAVPSTVPQSKVTIDGGGGGGDPSSDLSAMERNESMTPSGGEKEFDRNSDPALMRTGRFFGGLILDIKRRYPHYLSDITDAIHIQCFASFFFLYFACLTPIITFGGLLSHVTGGYLGTMESIISGAVVGILYALFSGQPMTIQGSTGPVLVFESIIYQLCLTYRWAYLSFRFWIGMWTALFLMIMVAFDLSALVRFITRFTEESFALLIALIFIIEALKKIYAISLKYPVNLDWSPTYALPPDCRCTKKNDSLTDYDLVKIARDKHSFLELPFIGTNETDAHRIFDNTTKINWDKINAGVYTWDALDSQRECAVLNGAWNEHGCEKFFAPDIFFFGVVLFMCCFFLSYMMRGMRNSRFFPNRIRSLIADFAVMIAIVVCTLLDWGLGLHTPKLQVPLTFEPTLGYAKRNWLVHPFNGNPWWTSLIAFGPALLAVILIFMDQQITSVIVNRRENKLKKGAGYHLDLLVVAITIVTNSILGIPWFVAATVLSINHVISLKKESESAAPGERPIFLGCREQRVTGFLIFLFIGLSVFMASILRCIPMAVLYGVFLLMGITSINDLQFIQRLGIVFMPAKYQPDYTYLRHVRLWRVHLFTVIQIICLALLWVIKSIKLVSILFPLMVLAMCFIRKLLDFIFTQEELHWLDDILPDSSCSKRQNKPALTDFSSKPTLESMPISEPLLLKGDGKAFSVSEEVSKTLIWRQLSGIGLVDKVDDDDDDDDDKKRRPRRKKGKSGRAIEEIAAERGERDGRGKKSRKPFRNLRLFSNDFDGGLGRDIAVLFHNTESEANQTDDNSASGRGNVRRSSGRALLAQPAQPKRQIQQPTSYLTTPEIHVNPPSNQGSPSNSRRGSKA